MLRNIVQMALLAALVGCAAVSAPLASRAGNPADPAAAESPPSAFALPTDLSRGESVPATDEVETNHSDSVFACPMHPEVQSDGPTECPKCGMKLVPVAEKPGRHS